MEMTTDDWRAQCISNQQLFWSTTEMAYTYSQACTDYVDLLMTAALFGLHTLVTQTDDCNDKYDTVHNVQCAHKRWQGQNRWTNKINYNLQQTEKSVSMHDVAWEMVEKKKITQNHITTSRKTQSPCDVENWIRLRDSIQNARLQNVFYLIATVGPCVNVYT